MMPEDAGTRERLIEAAGQLFADAGFSDVTVRQICQAAGANVAAVNYHFGDKLGLYREVLEHVIRRMQEATRRARPAEGGSAEARLRSYVRSFVSHVLAEGRESWLRRLIHREVSNPTPALDAIVERAIKPRLRELAGLVADFSGLPPDDPCVWRSVACIHALCVMALPHPVRDRIHSHVMPKPGGIDEIADHVSDFSIAGVRAATVGAAGGPKARQALRDRRLRHRTLERRRTRADRDR
jgi:TetR/AcrR family transcriptional regulator, regulator of cefoperazone and chloramphenicol sensitivity